MTSKPLRRPITGSTSLRKLLVRQPLRRDQQHVHFVGFNLFFDFAPFLTVGAVDGEGTDPESLGRLDLVAHEGQQRRHQQRRADSPVSQQPGGDEVHGALAPSGPLHQQHPPPLARQRQDRLKLISPEPGLRITGQPPQQRERLIREISWVAHAARTVGARCDVDAGLSWVIQRVTRICSAHLAVSAASAAGDFRRPRLTQSGGSADGSGLCSRNCVGGCIDLPAVAAATGSSIVHAVAQVLDMFLSVIDE